ncbi:unnamed protein product [Agarophyton chilense]
MLLACQSKLGRRAESPRHSLSQSSLHRLASPYIRPSPPTADQTGPTSLPPTPAAAPTRPFSCRPPLAPQTHPETILNPRASPPAACSRSGTTSTQTIASPNERITSSEPDILHSKRPTQSEALVAFIAEQLKTLAEQQKTIAMVALQLQAMQAHQDVLVPPTSVAPHPQPSSPLRQPSADCNTLPLPLPSRTLPAASKQSHITASPVLHSSSAKY